MNPSDSPPPTPTGYKWGWSHPVLSVLLAVSWVLLQKDVTVMVCLSALTLAWVIPVLIQNFLAPHLRIRSYRALLRLVWVVIIDIVVSNFVVARLVLSPGARPTPRWVSVPLSSQNEACIMLFACIITTTPGTVSCWVDEEQHCIWVHILDASGESQELAQQMKQRYEVPLMEMFG
jgi:multicomponent K+:H+ antiporter subunit E